MTIGHHPQAPEANRAIQSLVGVPTTIARLIVQKCRDAAARRLAADTTPKVEGVAYAVVTPRQGSAYLWPSLVVSLPRAVSRGASLVADLVGDAGPDLPRMYVVIVPARPDVPGWQVIRRYSDTAPRMVEQGGDAPPRAPAVSGREPPAVAPASRGGPARSTGSGRTRGRSARR